MSRAVVYLFLWCAMLPAGIGAYTVHSDSFFAAHPALFSEYSECERLLERDASLQKAFKKCMSWAFVSNNASVSDVYSCYRLLGAVKASTAVPAYQAQRVTVYIKNIIKRSLSWGRVAIMGAAAVAPLIVAALAWKYGHRNKGVVDGTRTAASSVPLIPTLPAPVVASTPNSPRFLRDFFAAAQDLREDNIPWDAVPPAVRQAMRAGDKSHQRLLTVENEKGLFYFLVFQGDSLVSAGVQADGNPIRAWRGELYDSVGRHVDGDFFANNEQFLLKAVNDIQSYRIPKKTYVMPTEPAKATDDAKPNLPVGPVHKPVAATKKSPYTVFRGKIKAMKIGDTQVAERLEAEISAAQLTSEETSMLLGALSNRFDGVSRTQKEYDAYYLDLADVVMREEAEKERLAVPQDALVAALAAYNSSKPDRPEKLTPTEVQQLGSLYDIESRQFRADPAFLAAKNDEVLKLLDSINTLRKKRETYCEDKIKARNRMSTNKKIAFAQQMRGADEFKII